MDNEKLKEKVDEELNNLFELGVNEQNVGTIGKLIDIKKDIAQIESIEKGENEMRYYGEYNGYGARRGRRRSYGEGNYNEGYGENYNESYSARGGNRGGNRGGSRGSSGGSYGHYPPEMYFDRMMDGYDNYMEGMDRYRRGGNYGDHEKGMESLEYMLEGIVGFFENLQENMESPEEVELIKKYARKIKEM